MSPVQKEIAALEERLRLAELGPGDGGNRRPDEKRGEGQVITAGERGHRQHGQGERARRVEGAGR